MKHGSMNFFADFGKWHREEVFGKVFKHKEMYKYLNST